LANVWMGIVVEDSGVITTVLPPNNATALLTGQWLWTKAFSVTPAGGPVNFEVDVKAKRKLNDSDVRLKIISNGDDIGIGGQFRALLIGG